MKETEFPQALGVFLGATCQGFHAFFPKAACGVHGFPGAMQEGSEEHIVSSNAASSSNARSLNDILWGVGRHGGHCITKRLPLPVPPYPHLPGVHFMKQHKGNGLHHGGGVGQGCEGSGQ